MTAWLFVAAALAPILPDPAMTPGAVDPAATVEVVCVPGYSKAARHVTAATKRRVYAAYGINPKRGGPYEVDHLISLALGGSNDPANLWPQSYVTTPWNARRKDALESRLHKMVCSGRVSLREAQEAIAGDWVAAYRVYMVEKSVGLRSGAQ